MKVKVTELAYTELDQIFNTVSNELLLVDRNVTVLRVNDRFLSISGMSRDEVIGKGKKCYEVFRNHLFHTPHCSLTRILGGEKQIECEVEKKRSDGAGTGIYGILTATPFL